MANLDVEAILTRIRGVVVDGLGSTRTIDATRFDSGNYKGQPEAEQSKLGMVNPRAEVRLVNMEAAKGITPSMPGDCIIYLLAFEISVVRHVDQYHKLTASARDSVNALAFTDGDLLAQALTYPGNVPSGSTGIVSECLQYNGSSPGIVNLEEGKPGLIETVHRFTGYARVTP